MTVFLEESGSGDPTLVLLHGLGATGAVWGPIVEELGPDRSVVVTDLPGHGQSGWLDSYGWEEMGRTLSRAIPGRELLVVGHSFGGAIGIALATVDPRVRGLVAMSIKVVWNEADLARAAAIAEAGVRWFDTEPVALERFEKVAGLSEHADPQLRARAVVEESSRFRLAQDPATNAAGPPPLQWLAQLRIPITMICGEYDSMVTGAQLSEWCSTVEVWEGVGHHPHLERPYRLVQLVKSFSL